MAKDDNLTLHDHNNHAVGQALIETTLILIIFISVFLTVSSLILTKWNQFYCIYSVYQNVHSYKNHLQLTHSIRTKITRLPRKIQGVGICPEGKVQVTLPFLIQHNH